jgi:alpha-glucosidase (family GH31 glycosyl hydrolase)
MPHFVSRRDVLKQLGTAGAGVLLAQHVIRGQGDAITIAGTPVEIVVASLSPTTIRITVVPIENGAPAALAIDGALTNETLGKPVAHARAARTFKPVAAGDLVVRYTENPPTIHVETKGGLAVQTLTLDAQQPGMSFLLPKGPLLGMGQGGPQLDRKGSIDTMRNGQGGYKLRTFGARVPIQWLVGTDGWGMFVHHPFGTFDLSGITPDGGKGAFTPGLVTGNTDSGGGPGTRADAAPLPLDLFIVASRDPLVIMREYARITGFPELPALWTLGYMQSTRTLEGPEKIAEIPRLFREKKLPCDAMIYLGTEFTPSGWNTRNGEFGFNPNNFPDPKAAIDAHHAAHMRIVLHIVIEGRRMGGTVSEPCDPKNAVPSGRTPDNKWPLDRNVACYWPYHKPLFDLGVDGFWPDQGDGLDGPSRLARTRMYWEGPQVYRPNDRPFALHRNGYAGMQRYGAFLWSGDTYSLWETLRNHVPIAINTGLSAIPYWGSDIGGFVATPELTGELYVRWFQFGAFCPSFRSHGRTWHLRLPWGWNTGELGIDEVRTYTGGAGNPDPSELHNAQVEPICKKYLELRYRLLPYSYTALRECHETGLPLMRALWLHHPEDATAVARGDQFLWGRDLLVAPVVDKGATSRKVYLPRGRWFDFWTEQSIEGGREITREVDLATMPLFVRAGAIVPLGPVKQYVDEPVEAPLQLVIYPGANGTATIYEDDGKTFEHRKGAFMKLALAWRDAERELTIALANGSKMRPPMTRTLEVRLAGPQTLQKLQTVKFSGKTLRVKL